MKIFKTYNKCIFCGSKKLKKNKSYKNIKNFYTDAIQNDLGISDTNLSKIKIYNCANCHILQHNPWFNEKTSIEIFNNIYGQNNKGWSNFVRFIKKGTEPNHGKLFEFIKNKISIKNYGEFNSPFKGLFINFFKDESNFNLKLTNKLFENIIKYTVSRQVGGKSKITQKKKFNDSIKYKKKIILLKKKLNNNKQTNKYFVFDNSPISWNYNDIYKSINSKMLLNEMFNTEIHEIENFPKKTKFDLFGIFHTLDHTLKPKKILDFALYRSNYVIFSTHTNLNVTKQHLFSFTNDFKKYLMKKKIYYLDLDNIINKNSSSNETYLICSKKKNLISAIS